jgi:AraC-like DNA-binding protein
MVARRSRSVLYERELAMNETLRYHELAPPAHLGLYVRCVWRLTGPASAVSTPEPILPDGCVELVINLSDPFIRTVPGAGSHQQPRRLVAGQISRAITIRPSGRIDLWGIRFHPWSAAAFLGISGAEVRDRLFALDEVSPLLDSASRYLPEVCEQRCLTLIWESLEACISRSRSLDPRIAALANMAIWQRESGSVGELARRAGLGARRVQALFRDEVGLTPKQLLRINRFQRALGIARSKPNLSWSAVASGAGYYDQAHLIRESRDIAGCTPATLLGRDAELTEVFLAG